ncbi:MAG: hypothetical protein GWP04_01640 [Gammaproteobacteria bacterium]|nr:hypothetical protein [Gammaproteobacteria bacterium]
MGFLKRHKKSPKEAAEATEDATRPEAEKTATTAESAPDEAAAETVEVPAEPAQPSPPEGGYRKVRVGRGMKGWGTGLVIQPEPGRDLIYSVTGGGIHPVAQRIADLTGGRPFDGFKSKAGFSEIAVAVIDCGGTARIGVYPMKGVLTVDVHGASPSGPLARFITEENFVSGVDVDNISLIED